MDLHENFASKHRMRRSIEMVDTEEETEESTGGITSPGKSKNSKERQTIFSKNPPINSSNVFSGSFVETEQVGKRSSLSRTLGEKIRSSLPSVGHHLRRFMKMKSQRETKIDRSTPDTPVPVASFNGDVATKIRRSDEDEDNDHPPGNSQSNFNESQALPSLASTSASLSDPRASDSSIANDLSTDSGVFGHPAAPAMMISSAVEASLDDSRDALTLGDIVAEEGSIIAGDPLYFAAALNAQLGYDRIRTYAELQARRESEPRSVPLRFFQEGTRESFTGSSTSAAIGSSTSGSENGSVNGVSEVAEDLSEESWPTAGRRQEERDEAQRYFEAARRAALRKQFRHLDDESPIY